MRILMVDDSEDVVETFKLLLECEGASVVTALSGPEALSLIKDSPFDLIISDIGMPSMDGYAFIKEVRGIPGRAGIPAIACTGFGRPQDADRASKSGFDAYVKKPAGIDEIVKAIAALGR
jgi:two-component system CheB/CheR fusion protein